MKKFFISIMTLLLSAAMLTGCGDGKDKENSSHAEQPEASYDWKTKGFTVSGDMEKNQKFWVAEYIPWNHENVVIDAEKEQLLRLNGDFSARVCGNRIYQMSTVINPPDIQPLRWVMEIFDTDTMSSSVREFSPEQLKLTDTSSIGFLTDMDVAGEDSFVFQWAEVAESSENMYHQTVSRMIYLNPDGSVHTAELWDTYLENGIEKDISQEFILMPQGSCVCDGAGNTYRKAGSSQFGYTRLYAINREGTVLLEYAAESEQAVEEPMRTESGELIYPVYDRKASCYYFMWPDVETGKMRTLGTIETSDRIKQLCGMQGNTVYYEIADGIVAWNVESGERTLAFNYPENGISEKYQITMALRKEQPPLLWLHRNGSEGTEDWFAPLSEEPVQKADAIRVVDLVGNGLGSRQVSECAALVSRKDLNQTILYQKAGQDTSMDAETFRTQIMTDLMAGDGPDILYVSYADMKHLQELGLLSDLSSLIPQETLEGLWPGVINMGTIDGKLAGLPGNIEAASGLAVARDTWAEGTWKLEDMISLMEEGHLENVIYYANPQIYFSPFATASMLLEYSLEDSFLIDWEKRESHFEDERFIRLLEVTGRGGDSLTDDTGSWFHGGRSIVFIDIYSSSQIYDFGVSADRENGSFTGFPTSGNCGNYLQASGMLVVNINAANAAGIETYLKYFLGDEIQGICDSPSAADSALSVRRFSEDEIEKSPEGDYLWRGEKLSVMEDGTTSLHQAVLFLESCVPAPAQHPDLMVIIREELEAFYAGDKSPRQTAEIIDSRIQVYLDEMN